VCELPENVKASTSGRHARKTSQGLYCRYDPPESRPVLSNDTDWPAPAGPLGPASLTASDCSLARQGQPQGPPTWGCFASRLKAPNPLSLTPASRRRTAIRTPRIGLCHSHPVTTRPLRTDDKHSPAKHHTVQFRLDNIALEVLIDSQDKNAHPNHRTRGNSRAT
jgi:hypothetical protein